MDIGLLGILAGQQLYVYLFTARKAGKFRINAHCDPSFPLFPLVAGDHDHNHANHSAPGPKTMLFHRSHSFDHFGMSGYYNRNCGSLSLSKRTQSCGFRHFSVLAGSHAILPLERCVELAHTLIPHSLRNLLNGHPGGADQLLCSPEALLNQKAVNRHAIGAAKPFFQEGGGKRKTVCRGAQW